jgi:hypothetical protein
MALVAVLCDQSRQCRHQDALAYDAMVNDICSRTLHADSRVAESRGELAQRWHALAAVASPPRLVHPLADVNHPQRSATRPACAGAARAAWTA